MGWVDALYKLPILISMQAAAILLNAATILPNLLWASLVMPVQVQPLMSKNHAIGRRLMQVIDRLETMGHQVRTKLWSTHIRQFLSGLWINDHLKKDGPRISSKA